MTSPEEVEAEEERRRQSELDWENASGNGQVLKS